MDAHEVAKLSLGLYRTHWKTSGTSLAAVGINRAGLHWLAPINWVSIGSEDNQLHWDDVARVEAIEPGGMESDDGESPADATPDISEKLEELERKTSAILDAAQKSIRINMSLHNEVIGLRKRTDDLLKLHEKPAGTLPSVSIGAPLDGTISGDPGIYSPPGPHSFRLEEPSPPLDKEEEDQHLHRTIEHLGTQGDAMIAGATVCKSCEDGAPTILDEDGVRSDLSGKPGRWAHASIDGHWVCDNPPSVISGLVPYLFGPEMISFGLATSCEEEDCESGLVIDNVCTYCGKEYPGHQGDLELNGKDGARE